MTREQFERERNFSVALALAKTLLSQGLISIKEYRKLEAVFVKKYRPIFGAL